ncbi:hypothetical protein PR048_023070 [Dryococelus australis]|uniref:Uncharacterized protein n=1 Tax=Dryococelus australis TaxID=614101 RepID=A0ABQ9GT35_9NEOP|nr:hypothetical protein PR048_023070 [Dryococelus australis]
MITPVAPTQGMNQLLIKKGPRKRVSSRAGPHQNQRAANRIPKYTEVEWAHPITHWLREALEVGNLSDWLARWGRFPIGWAVILAAQPTGEFFKARRSQSDTRPVPESHAVNQRTGTPTSKAAFHLHSCNHGLPDLVHDSSFSRKYGLQPRRHNAIRELQPRWSMATTLASHRGDQGSIPNRVTPGMLHMGIVSDDAAGRRVFSEIYRFPIFAFRLCFISTSCHSHRL